LRRVFASASTVARVVERLLVDDEARMRRGLEHLHQLAQRDVLLHRDDVGARYHDVGDPPLAQCQDVLEHRAFFRREAGVAVRAGLEHDLEVGADRAGLPAEHGAQDAGEPALVRIARLVGGGHRDRQVADLGGRLGRLAGFRRFALSHGISGQAYGSGTPSRARIRRSRRSIASACPCDS
jgi:hypothetical protein